MHCPKGSTVDKLVAVGGVTDLRNPFVKKGYFGKLNWLKHTFFV